MRDFLIVVSGVAFAVMLGTFAGLHLYDWSLSMLYEWGAPE